MGGGGFEPPKQFAADLQSVPFGHSGIHPFIEFLRPVYLYHTTRYDASVFSFYINITASVILLTLRIVSFALFKEMSGYPSSTTLR